MVEASYGKGIPIASAGLGGGIIGTLLVILVIVILVAVILRVLNR